MIRPWRSPIDLPEMVKDYIKGKTFCEIGCGEGDLLKIFAKYASKTIGIEVKEKYFPALDKIDKNIEIIKNSIFNIKIPKCEVYYFWIRPKIDKNVLRILPPSTIITYKAIHNKQWIESEFSKYPGKVEYIDFISKEDFDYPEGYINVNTPLVIGILHKEK